MRVLCTGPEASGTKLLTRTVATGADAFHLSMPNARNWWNPETVEFDRAVVIVRDRHITARSALNARHVTSVEQGLEQRDRAISALSRLSPALWVTYEGIFADPEGWLSVVAGWLEVDLSWPEPLRDGNEKWRPGV